MRTSRSRAGQAENERTAPGPAAGRKASPGGAAVPPPLTADALHAAQCGAGNAAVTAMIARRARPTAAPQEQDHGVHEVLRSAGKPLAAPVRQDMESRFGTDFSDVRLHTGPAAARSARAIGARAYTSGSHVVIGDGGGDKHTLAHELTHVVQQRQGPVSGTDNGAGLSVSDPSDRFEREAEATATRVMSRPAGRPVAAQTAPAAPAPVPELPVQRMEGFEVEVDKRVKDRLGNKLAGDTNLAQSERENFTVVSDSRRLDAGGNYSNVEFVSGAVQVVGSQAEAGPAELDRIVDEIKRVRDDFYAAVNGTPLESATVDLQVLPGGRDVTLSNEGYTEKAGRPGKGDGLYVQYTVGVPLAGVPLMFRHYREEAPSLAEAPLPRALFRLNQAAPFAEAELAKFENSATGKKRARTDTDSLDGFLQLYYTQVAAMADYLAQEQDGGQIKNLTIFLSRSRLADAFKLLDSDTQAYLRRNNNHIVNRLAAFQEKTETPGQKLDFFDRGTRALPGLEPVTLETYARSALKGEPSVSQQQVFGGMNEIAPHSVEGSTVIPMEIRAMGNYYKTWDELKAELRKIAGWAQEGYERDREIHGPGGSRR
ncbi:DUF4157 domain-containing protein [Streptomyces glaucescens]|uniref:eCIS core domain-containing protein n=1 Tax=Streptomyces glaucescens TaxID=1907 RepID=A0A089X4Z1_STRGA|nr:DUF4157 domain-containing protein [Streptomyces glaucescens]AIR98932.1 hypothetical protein SGLAU_14745 [Streptomyces glaucescens]